MPALSVPRGGALIAARAGRSRASKPGRQRGDPVGRRRRHRFIGAARCEARTAGAAIGRRTDSDLRVVVDDALQVAEEPLLEGRAGPALQSPPDRTGPRGRRGNPRPSRPSSAAGPTRAPASRRSGSRRQRVAPGSRRGRCTGRSRRRDAGAGLGAAARTHAGAITPYSHSRPRADPRARPKRCEARSKAGSAAEGLPPRGNRKERMKGPRPARMPGYGAGSKCFGPCLELLSS